MSLPGSIYEVAPEQPTSVAGVERNQVSNAHTEEHRQAVAKGMIVG